MSRAMRSSTSAEMSQNLPKSEVDCTQRFQKKSQHLADRFAREEPGRELLARVGFWNQGGTEMGSWNNCDVRGSKNGEIAKPSWARIETRAKCKKNCRAFTSSLYLAVGMIAMLESLWLMKGLEMMSSFFIRKYEGVIC
jgi:hypothetical protein